MLFYLIFILLILIFILTNVVLQKKIIKDSFKNDNIKILVIICSHEFSIKNRDNIKVLNNFMVNLPNIKVDYCGISNINDFHNYENIIPFKYKVVNKNKQFSKICDFITDNKKELNYDWFIKIRPDVKLIEMFDFNLLSNKAINARARLYRGPKKIKYGMSVNGEGIWKNIGDCFYNNYEKEVILDDILYIFHNNVVKMGAFDKIPKTELENEWFHTKIWKNRKIDLNVIHIYIT